MKICCQELLKLAQSGHTENYRSLHETIREKKYVMWIPTKKYHFILDFICSRKLPRLKVLGRCYIKPSAVNTHCLTDVDTVVLVPTCLQTRYFLVWPNPVNL